MTFCSNCGKRISSEERVCPNCQKPVRRSMQSMGQVKQSRETQESYVTSQKQPISRIVIIAIILIAIIIAGAAIIIVNKNQNSNNASTKEESTTNTASSVTVAPTQTVVPTQTVAPTQTPAPMEKPISDVTYYVTGVLDKIHLFEKANPNSLITGDLKNKDTVKLLDNAGSTYWKVLSDQDNLVGYIDKHYLTDDPKAVIAPQKVYVNEKTGMMLYKEADETSEKLGKLNNGDAATVLAETKGDFWYVYAESLKQYGFLKKQNLSANKPTPTPTVMPTQTPTPTPVVTVTPQPDYVGSGSAPSSYSTYHVSVSSGYLALRNGKTLDNSNEIARIQNGQDVYVIDTPNETYWNVYVPSLGMWGYVNQDYLTSNSGNASPSTTSYNVTVDGGYLALRNAPALSASNEIGQLYTGDTVEVADTNGIYWWVYSSKYGAWGYVNGSYLSKDGSGSVTVQYSVKAEGYLALRNFPSFAYENEIGKLYTGDVVEVADSSGTYWWVYSSKHGVWGYVNGSYLVKN